MHHRSVHLVAVLSAALVALLLPAAAAADVVELRVEGPRDTVFQGSVRPLTGDLTDQDGNVHTTARETPLGALLRASDRRGFPVEHSWFDCCGGGWAGFFVNSIAGTPGDASHFWALKIGRTLAPAGAGAIAIRQGRTAFFYWTRFDQDTGATQPTLGVKASDRSVAPNRPVTFTVRSYDDAGDARRAQGAVVWAGGLGAGTGLDGKVSLRFRSAGRHCVEATRRGAIRSQSLCVTVSSP